MSRIDDELLREVNEGSADPEPAVAESRERVGVEATKPAPSRAGWALLGLLLVMGGGLTALILTSTGNAAVYSAGVDQLLADRANLAGRNVRVEGSLVKGSLVKRDQPCEYRFTVERKGVRLPVHFPQCSLPDTFRDVPYTDVMVTAEGQLVGDHFQATSILAKCPSKYEEKQGSLLSPKHPGAQHPGSQPSSSNLRYPN